MLERKGLVLFGDNPATLLGQEIKVGEKAVDFMALKGDLSEFHLSDLQGKIKIISVVPSLDTRICNLQTIRFNQQASQLENTEVLTISMDLPFAQKRFCESFSIDHVTTLSDHRDADFGLKYGLLMKETRLLARAVLVIDQDDVIRYFHIEDQIKQEPDYQKALEVVRRLIK